MSTTAPQHIAVTGALAADARALRTVQGQWLVRVVLGHGPDAATVRAEQHIGAGESAAIAAKSKAHHLRAGAVVTVRAHGWRIRSRALALLGVDAIDATYPTLTTRQAA